MVDAALLPENWQRITVKRCHIWNDANHVLHQPSFDHKVGLNINFIGQQTHDTREIVALRKNCSLLSGQESKRILAHNVTALQQKEYLLVGCCITLALVYGGGAPHFFSEVAVSYDEPINESKMISDQDVNEKVKSRTFALLYRL